jgi:hypothetical protein
MKRTKLSLALLLLLLITAQLILPISAEDLTLEIPVDPEQSVGGDGLISEEQPLPPPRRSCRLPAAPSISISTCCLR